MIHDGTDYLTIRERIEDQLVPQFLKRLNNNLYGRTWLNSSDYLFEFDDSIISYDFEEHHFGESAYSYLVIAFTEDELNDFIDRLCIQIEKHMKERLNKISKGKVSYNEGPLSVVLDYRFVKVIFRYSILEW